MANELLSGCAGLSAATLYEANAKRGAVGPNIRAICPSQAMAGLAVTVRCWPGDARALWDAVARLREGDVLVCDMGGSPDVTALGGSTVRAAINRGVAGIVTNCSVRDVSDIRQLGLPVFAAGVNLMGTQKLHRGWQDVAVVIGNAVVHPGDLIVGDNDGLVVIAAADAADVVERAHGLAVRELEQDRRLAAGEDPAEVLGL